MFDVQGFFMAASLVHHVVLGSVPFRAMQRRRLLQQNSGVWKANAAALRGTLQPQTSAVGLAKEAVRSEGQDEQNDGEGN